ncbi:MAG: pseudouridine synthase [Chitinophagaceae bacterium]|nr:pseudouridine synthase [Chitinophagaceae bacterium]
MFRYFIIYKPYQVLSQFSSEQDKNTLKDFFSVPPDVYSIGRLDFDSEGLLILTNDKQLNYRLLNPLFNHEREYWVQVEGSVTANAVEQLEAGILINAGGKFYRTKKCRVVIFKEMVTVAERNPPVRFRKMIPTSWIKLILTEGKNRQVRKMTAAAGYPTLRLIRARIGRLTLQALQPGEMKELSKEEIYSLCLAEG